MLNVMLRSRQLLSCHNIFMKICMPAGSACCQTYSPSRVIRYFSKESDPHHTDEKPPPEDLEKSLSSLKKFDAFTDDDSPVILDIQEEKFRVLQEEPAPDEFFGVRLERGVEGVYDIEDLVELLRREKAEHIFVARVPFEAKYVDYIVVVTGRSPRHMTAMAEFVRKVYKKKRLSTDILPKIEGEGSKHWIALDLGNIALHIFSPSSRKVYDIESLWTLGADYDEKANQIEGDPINELLLRHSVYIGDLEPANSDR